MVFMKAGKCPSEVLSLTNRLVLHPRDVDAIMGGSGGSGAKHVVITGYEGQRFVFTVEPNDQMLAGYLGFSLPQRKWVQVDVNQDIEVLPFRAPDPDRQFVASLLVEVDFFNKKKITQDNYDTDMMAREFLMQFPNQCFSVGQPVVFQFRNMPLTQLVIKEVEAADLKAVSKGAKQQNNKVATGVVLANTAVIFEKAEGSCIRLVGKSKGKVVRQSIINPDWDFSKMGIGGLDTQFNAIFRRAFASRVFPPEVMESLGCKHVKGILKFFLSHRYPMKGKLRVKFFFKIMHLFRRETDKYDKKARPTMI